MAAAVVENDARRPASLADDLANPAAPVDFPSPIDDELFERPRQLERSAAGEAQCRLGREETGKEHAGSGFILDGDRVGEELEQGAQAGVLEVGVDGTGNAHRREGE